MSDERIYQTPESTEPTDLSNRTQAPLYWTRMLRFSIYFTILGVILCFLLAYAARNAMAETAVATDGGTDAQVGSMLTFLERIIFSSKFLMMFLIMGATSIIISLFMRSKEKRLRA